MRHYDYWDLMPLHLSILVLYSEYCTLPTSAQLRYDVCCLWRRHVELRGRAAEQPHIPRDAILGALWRQARGNHRLWQLDARSSRRTFAHLPAGTLRSTVYTLQYTLQAITIKSNVRVSYLPRAFEEWQTIAARKIVSFSTCNKLTSTFCLPTCFCWINFPIFLDITMQFVIRILC